MEPPVSELLLSGTVLYNLAGAGGFAFAFLVGSDDDFIFQNTKTDPMLNP